MSKEIKAVWIIIDKKQWSKDNKNQRVLHGCWLLEENAEAFAKKTYGDEYAEWALITPLLVMENNTLEKALNSVYSRLECIFNYCPSPNECKENNICNSPSKH